MSQKTVDENARKWLVKVIKQTLDMTPDHRAVVKMAVASCVLSVSPVVSKEIRSGVAMAALQRDSTKLASDAIDRYLERRVAYQWLDQSDGPDGWASGTLATAADHARETGRDVQVFRDEILIATFKGGDA